MQITDDSEDEYCRATLVTTPAQRAKIISGELFTAAERERAARSYASAMGLLDYYPASNRATH